MATKSNKTCARCNYTFSQKQKLDAHQEPKSCSNCGFAFKCKTIMRHHEAACQLCCTFCNKEFSSKHERQRHCRTSTCSICPQTFPCNGLMGTHTKVNHAQGYACPCTWNAGTTKCSKEYATEHGLRIHLEQIHKNRCMDCNEDFGTRYDLGKHRRDMHGDDSLFRYGCPQCPRRFVEAWACHQHQQPGQHDCGSIFRCTTQLLKHAAECERLCPKCDRVFMQTDGNDFQQHWNQQHGSNRRNRLVVCEFCEIATNAEGWHVFRNHALPKDRMKCLPKDKTNILNNRDVSPGDYDLAVEREELPLLSLLDMEKKLQQMVVKLDAARTKFQDAIKERPDHVCMSCERAMYKQQGREVKDAADWHWVSMNLNSDGRLKHLEEFIALRNKKFGLEGGNAIKWKWICHACRRYVTKKEMPRYAMENGLRVPNPPPEIGNLRPIEAKFVKLTIPYQTVKCMGSHTQVRDPFSQTGIYGMTYCFENSIMELADQLPHRMDNVDVVLVRAAKPTDVDAGMPSGEPALQRVEVSNLRNLVRQQAVYAALRTLKARNVLYHDVDIEMDPDNDGTMETDKYDDELKEADHNGTLVDEPDDGIESGGLRSYLQKNLQSTRKVPVVELRRSNGDIVSDDDLYNCLEAMAFPEIYWTGTNHFATNRQRHLDLQEYVELRLNHYSRRWSRNHEWVFFMKSIYQRKVLRGAVAMTIQRKPPSKKSLPSFVHCTTGMDVKRDDADQYDYHGEKEVLSKRDLMDLAEKEKTQDVDVFCHEWTKKIRGTPAYWQVMKRDVLSATRDFGPPSLWMTFSSNDLHWKDHVSWLSAMDDGSAYVDPSRVVQMSHRERSYLLHRDQVVSAQLFQHRMDSLIKTMLEDKDLNIFLFELEGYFLKNEFQGRGSTHGHLLLWLKGFPADMEKSWAQRWIINHWIKLMLTVQERCDDSGFPYVKELADVLIANEHSHRPTCGPLGYCRFKMPKEQSAGFRWISPQENKRKKLRKCEFYALPRTTETECSRTPVFLPLTVVDAHFDCQVINGAHGLICYLCDYFVKGEHVGIHNAIKAALTKLPANASRFSQQFAQGRTILTYSAQSLQECAYILGGRSMPLRRSSFTFVHVQTLPSEFVWRRLKRNQDLQFLDDADTKIYMENIRERYARRPVDGAEMDLPAGIRSWDLMTLEQFAKWFQSCSHGAKCRTRHQLQNRDGADQLDYVCARRKPAVVSAAFRSPTKWGDFAYYAPLLLYYPWRNEVADLMGIHTSASAALKALRQDPKRADCIPMDRYQKMMHLVDEIENDEDDIKGLEIVHPELAAAVEEREKNRHKGALVDTIANMDLVFTEDEKERMEAIQAGAMDATDFDAQYALRCKDSEDVQANHNASILLTDEEFLVRSSNVFKNLSQAEILLEIMEAALSINEEELAGTWTNDRCVCKFISGGAGAGKSYLISVMLQMLTCIFEAVPVVMAPTGVAAQNCNALTMHSAVGLPIDDRKHGTQPYLEIDRHPKQVDIRRRLSGAQCIIMDEASMVSSDNLLMLHRRLQELCKPNGSSSLFGTAKMILCVGDFHQLAPVRAPWIFQPVRQRRLADLHMGDDPQLWSNFDYSEIEGSVRQQGNPIWISFLSWLATKPRRGENAQLPTRFRTLLESITSVANGGHVPLKKIKSTQIRKQVHLFCRDRQVRHHNEQILEEAKRSNRSAYHVIESEHRMYDDGRGNLHSRQMMSTVPRLSRKEVDYYLGDDDDPAHVEFHGDYTSWKDQVDGCCCGTWTCRTALSMELSSKVYSSNEQRMPKLRSFA